MIEHLLMVESEWLQRVLSNEWLFFSLVCQYPWNGLASFSCYLIRISIGWHGKNGQRGPLRLGWRFRQKLTWRPKFPKKEGVRTLLPTKYIHFTVQQDNLRCPNGWIRGFGSGHQKLEEDLLKMPFLAAISDVHDRSGDFHVDNITC